MGQNIKLLKSKNPLVELVHEDGYELVKTEKAGILRAVQDPSLTVDCDKDRYFWGSKSEKGDQLTWLQRRYSWQMSQALKYLEHRAELIGDLRPSQALIPVGQTESGSGPEAESKKGKRTEVIDLSESELSVEMLEELAVVCWDWPKGYERLARLGLREIIDFLNVFPRNFISLVGIFDEDLYCQFCMKSFTGWQEPGLVFQAVDFGPNMEAICTGLYCAGCVASFRRWVPSLEKLLITKKFVE